MADNIKIKRGNITSINNIILKDGELAFAKDTKELIIGSEKTNTKLNSPDKILTAEEDLRFPATAVRQGANTKPVFDEVNVGLTFPQNDTTHILYIVAQMPHSWDIGGMIFPHVHVIQEQDLQAVFKMEYKWYNLGDDEPATWETYTMDTYVKTYASGSLVNMIVGTGIDGTGKTESSILKIKLYRDDNVYTGNILFDEFDIHYQVEKFGEDLEGEY